MNEAESLPPPFHVDAQGNDLGWHALNYRTAHTIHAQPMWEALERYVREEVRQAVAAERRRAAVACLQLTDGIDPAESEGDAGFYDAAIKCSLLAAAVDDLSTVERWAEVDVEGWLQPDAAAIRSAK